MQEDIQQLGSDSVGTLRSICCIHLYCKVGELVILIKIMITLCLILPYSKIPSASKSFVQADRV